MDNEQTTNGCPRNPELLTNGYRSSVNDRLSRRCKTEREIQSRGKKDPRMPVMKLIHMRQTACSPHSYAASGGKLDRKRGTRRVIKVQPELRV